MARGLATDLGIFLALFIFKSGGLCRSPDCLAELFCPDDQCDQFNRSDFCDDLAESQHAGSAFGRGTAFSA